MTEPIKPATDSEISEWREDILGERPEDGNLAGVRWMEEDEWAYRLVHRIESDAARIKAMELDRDTIQEYADQVGANLRAAEGTLAERDEQIARYEDLLIDIKLALSNTKTFYLPLAEAVADIIRRKKEADRGAI